MVNLVFRVVFGIVADLPHIKQHRNVMISLSFCISAVTSMLAKFMKTPKLVITYAVVQGVCNGNEIYFKKRKRKSGN